MQSEYNAPRMCKLLGSAALSSLKYARYFCVLQPKEPENSFFSAVGDFCFQCPLTAARCVGEDIPGVF